MGQQRLVSHPRTLKGQQGTAGGRAGPNTGRPYCKKKRCSTAIQGDFFLTCRPSYEQRVGFTDFLDEW